jgi:hypothetical protein
VTLQRLHCFRIAWFDVRMTVCTAIMIYSTSNVNRLTTSFLRALSLFPLLSLRFAVHRRAPA